MNRRNPPAKWVLPEVVDPPERICYRVEVPNDRQHIAAFYGAILSLASAYKWQDDPAHTAREVALVWRDIFDNLIKQECSDPPPEIIGGGVDGDELMIRQNPDNPCLLETSINGTDWCVFADFSLCIPSSQQPGSSPQPNPGGGQQCYQGELNANSLWLAPVVVSTGDVVELTSAAGAGYDASGSLRWYCPNGQTFYAGACVGSPATDAGDPLNTVGHMRLIWSIDGTYYDAMAGPVTVPSGVSSAQAILQVNDPVLPDNSGTYTIEVCVTNNQAGSWSSTFDFAVSPYSSLLSLVWGVWNPGVGYDGTFVSGAQQSGVAYTMLASSVDLLSMTAYYDCASASGASQTLAFYQGPGGYIGSPTVPTVGTNVPFNQTITGVVNQPGFQVGSGSSAGPVAHNKLIITGTGTKPSGWPA